jgi:adenylosuccinate lyase
MGRKEAYLLVAELCEEAERERKPLWEVASHDSRVLNYLGEEKIRSIFDLDRVLRNVEASFARVFPSGYNPSCDD